MGTAHSLMEPGLGWHPQPRCSPRRCKMPGSLPVCNLSWLPRTHSTTSTLLSLEPEAFRALLLLLLITHRTLAGMECGLRFSTSRSFFTGISPSGVPSFLLPGVVNCLNPAHPAWSGFNAPPSRGSELPTSFFCSFCSRDVSCCFCLPRSSWHSVVCGMWHEHQ